MKKIILFVLMLAMISCNVKHHRKHKQKGTATVKCYKVDNKSTKELDDFLYYYIIDAHFDGGGSYYCYTSSTPVSNFSTANWVQMTSVPNEINNQTPIAELEENVSELPDTMEADVEAANDAEGDGGGESSEGDGGGESSDGDGGGDGGGGDGGGGDGGGGE